MHILLNIVSVLINIVSILINVMYILIKQKIRQGKRNEVMVTIFIIIILGIIIKRIIIMTILSEDRLQ